MVFGLGYFSERIRFAGKVESEISRLNKRSILVKTDYKGGTLGNDSITILTVLWLRQPVLMAITMLDFILLLGQAELS